MRLPTLLVLGALPFFPGVAAAEGGSGIEHHSFFSGWPPETHPLDETARFLEEGERLQCDPDALIRYRSPTLRYGVRAHPAFVERLKKFEALVVEYSMEHYGRAPRRVVHRGSYNCRTSRGRRGRISEHAFGNALDLRGFDFPPLRRQVESPENMPRRMRRAFRLRVQTHWGPRFRRDAYHAEFLHGLAERLRARPDIFRGIVGPPRPRHADHLHLDASPWRYAMFGYETPE
ncbi:MAG: extensin family protein [Myxococcota bacterium]